MKKALVLVAMILLVSLSLQAQTAATNPIYIGARAGMNLGTASFSPDLPSGVSKSMRTGLAAGIYAEFGVAEGLSISAEGLYSQEGVKLSAGGSDETFKVDFIKIPVNLRYAFNIPNSTVKPFIFGGGNVGITAKGEVETTLGTTDIKDSLESASFGIQFGAGVSFEVSPGVNLFLDGQYCIGLKNLSKYADQEIKPSNIGIMVGCAFKVN